MIININRNYAYKFMLEGLIGAIGAILILSAWIPETYRTMKSKNLEAIDLKFLMIYLIGSILMTIYSIQIKSDVFIALNTAITIILMIELDLVLRKKVKKKRH